MRNIKIKTYILKRNRIIIKGETKHDCRRRIVESVITLVNAQ